jgi:hypothetical protein
MSDFRYRATSIVSIVGLALMLIPTQAAHSESYVFVDVSIDLSFAKGGAESFYGYMVQEKNGSQTRALTSRPSDGNFKFTVPISEDPWKIGFGINEVGAYKRTDKWKMSNAGVTGIRISQTLKIDKDISITVKIPVPQKKISLRIVDASGNLAMNSSSKASLTEKYLFTQSGFKWELESSGSNGENISSPNGTFEYYFYEGTSFSLSVNDSARSAVVETPRSIKVSKDLEVVMCLPLNFPAGVRSLSLDCLQVQMQQEIQSSAKAAADKAAADKAAADKAAADKAAADNANRISMASERFLKINLEIDGLIKLFPSRQKELAQYKNKLATFRNIDQTNVPTAEVNLAGVEAKITTLKIIYNKISKTIKCTNGKKSVKVKDVKPVCPSGFRLKK